VLIALGINREGRRRVRAVELANRESATSGKDFLLTLQSRGLRGVLLAIGGGHPGLKQAMAEVWPEARWQRCYVHFLRHALDYPRKADVGCLTELRWLPATGAGVGGGATRRMAGRRALGTWNRSGNKERGRWRWRPEARAARPGVAGAAIMRA